MKWNVEKFFPCPCPTPCPFVRDVCKWRQDVWLSNSFILDPPLLLLPSISSGAKPLQVHVSSLECPSGLAFCPGLGGLFGSHKLGPHGFGDPHPFAIGCWLVGVEDVPADQLCLPILQTVTHLFESKTLESLFVVCKIFEAQLELLPSFLLFLIWY